MKGNLNSCDSSKEPAEFTSFTRRHDARMMKIVLGILLLLDLVYYIHLGSVPMTLATERLRWMVLTFTGSGFLLGIWLVLQGEAATPGQDYVFVALLLASRVMYGNLIGFEDYTLVVYVGLMLLLSAQFYFGRRIIFTILFLQILLHLEALLGWLGPDTVHILLITDIFAAVSALLSCERYKNSLSAYFMDQSNMEKNTQLMQAHQKITLYNEQMEAQKNQLEQLSRMKDVVLSINHRLSEDVNLDTFLDYVLSRVREVMPHADLGCVLLLQDEETLVMASSFGYNQEESLNFRLPVNETFAYRVTGGNHTKTVIINDIQSMLHEDYVAILENKEHYVVQSSISGPILKDSRLYGFINIDSHENNVYTENDIAIMEYLREQLGIALSRRELYRGVVYLSKHDQLTGFLNRWYVQELETEFAPRWRRYGVEVLLAAMDLNDLKRVNDQLGHHEGDAYLQTFSTCLKQTFRSTDVLIRLGGDEFAGVFYQMAESELAGKLDEVNRMIAESPLQMRAQSIALGFGYGIVRFGEIGVNIQALLQIADERMYVHKTAMKAKKAEDAVQ